MLLAAAAVEAVEGAPRLAPPPAGPEVSEVSAVPSRSGRPARHVHVLEGVPEQRKFVFPRDPSKAQSISLLNCVRMHLATNLCETQIPSPTRYLLRSFSLQRTFAKRIHLATNACKLHTPCNARLRNVYTSQRTFANCVHLATQVCEIIRMHKTCSERL